MNSSEKDDLFSTIEHNGEYEDYDRDRIIIDEKYISEQMYSLRQLPEAKRFHEANPNQTFSGENYAVMLSHAIHWMAIFDVIWPNFYSTDFVSIEVKYLVTYDPDNRKLPMEFFLNLLAMIKMFWYFRLTTLYPCGIWKIEVFNDPEMTIQATISSRG